MKSKTTLVTLACIGALLFGLRGLALSEKTGDVSIQDASGIGKSPDVRVRLDRAAAKVRDRLHMSSTLEVSDDPAEEAEIAELYRSGWIIDASVEEVEAALKAAAATPAIEDDFAAGQLAHRASCRYFMKD